MFGAGCWAAYSIASKKVLVDVDPLRAVTYGTVVGAVALTIMAIPSLVDVNWTGVSYVAWVNVAYLAVGPTALAFLLYYRALRSVSPSTATMMMFTVPVFGIACSVLFLGESFTLVQAMGAVVMLIGALLAVLAGRIRCRRAQPSRTLGA